MVATLNNTFSTNGSPESFGAEDLKDGTTVKEGDWVNIAEVRGNSNKAYAPGFGKNDRRTNSQGWSDLDLVLTSDGGTTFFDAGGKVRFAIYGDLEKDNLIARTGTFRANVLRSAVSASATDKVLIAALWSKAASQDSVLTVQYKAEPSEDGYTVSQSNSSNDYGLAYGEIPT